MTVKNNSTASNGPPLPEELRDALQLLTADQQQALTLKYIAGLPDESIAKVMNTQAGTVRGLQMRGLQILAKYMKEKEAI